MGEKVLSLSLKACMLNNKNIWHFSKLIDLFNIIIYYIIGDK